MMLARVMSNAENPKRLNTRLCAPGRIYCQGTGTLAV